MQFQRNWLLVGRNGVLKVWRWWKTRPSETQKMKSSWSCMMGGPSMVQEPSRKQDHPASRKDQWRGRWGSLLVLTKAILLYFIPLTHWRILIRKVESLLKTGFMTSSVQSLALPGPLSQLFATILVAVLFLSPSTIQMNNQCRKGQSQRSSVLLPPGAQPRRQNSMPPFHLSSCKNENPNKFWVMKSTLRVIKAKAYSHL